MTTGIEREKINIGLKVGHLTVKGFTEPKFSVPAYVVCICECGNEVKRHLGNFSWALTAQTLHHISCGCMHNDKAKRMVASGKMENDTNDASIAWDLARETGINLKEALSIVRGFSDERTDKR